MEQLKSEIEKVILKNFTKGSIHGLNGSSIPPKKLENVKTLHNIKDEEVLFIYDATLFGSAKDGMVFTSRGIYWREVLDSPQNLDYREIIESTANQDLRSKAIFVLDQDEKIEIKETYYKLLCDLRSELKSSSIVYDTYYKSALKRAEEYLTLVLKKDQFRQIVEWFDKYEGLFLKPKHKSVKIREIAFQAYLYEKMFPKAQEELEVLKDENPVFYQKAAPLLDLAIRQERYLNLETRRIKAIETQDFPEAYILFEEQRALNIRNKKDQLKVELEIKEAHYESLNQGRLSAMEQENYDLAFSILEHQQALNIRREFEIEKLKKAIENSKKETLETYLETLNIFLEKEMFLEAEQVKEQIYMIEPLYPLEREKILLTIYKYDLKKAKEEISKVSDPQLKSELEEILEKTIKILHEKIRKAVRNKQYDIFEKRPDIWNYRDEYGMCVLYYFALEADLNGILKALEHVDLLLMPANIFGHNFVDLIGFACDPNLGGRKENPLDLLNKIKNKVDLQQIHDRINFLKTGQERYFFSYKLSQEDRLSELNQKLISPEHFKQVLIEIENQTNNHVDKIIKQLFARELEAMSSYPEKDQFETSEAYKKRCKGFKKQYLDRPDFIAEYKRQNQSTVEGIAKLLADKKSCFIPSISALVEYKNKELEALKALETHEDVLELLNLYFPIKQEVITVEIGAYDADNQVFLMLIEGKTEEMPMPLSIAKEFRKTFDQIEYVRIRMIKDGKVIWGTVPRYSSKVKW